MPTEFDLSNLKKGQPIKAKDETGNQPIIRNRNDMDIPIPRAKEVDPIFDTPPVRVMPKNDSEITTINESNSTTVTRTPTLGDKPTAKHPVRGSDDAVPDPQPLKVMNNFIPKSDGELKPFDPSVLPKKKKEQAVDEKDVYDSLEAAVNREMQSITERTKALTEKQYEEYLEARAEGRVITPPKTDAQVEEDIIHDVESHYKSHQSAEEIIAGESSSDDEILGPKKIIIRGDDDDSEQVVAVSKDEAIDRFGDELAGAIKFIQQRVLTQKNATFDVYTKAMHAKNFLAKEGIYAAMYSIVMWDDEDKVVAHPMLVSTRDDITAIIEVNDTGCLGIHFLDPNETVESVLLGFWRKGLLYQYIDYLARAKVVKMPVDKTPSAELAIDIANSTSSEENNTMELTPAQENTEVIPSEVTHVDEVPTPTEDDLAGAINEEEAAALIENEDNYDDETADDSVDEKEETTGNDTSEDDSYMNLPSHDDIKDETGYDAEDTNPVVITKKAIDEDTEMEESNPEEYESLVSDDIEKDLNKELGETSKSEEEMLDELRTAIRSHSNSIKKKINLRDFKIADTPISASQVATFSIKDVNQADWVLPNAKRVITVRGLSGPELFAMNPQNSNKNKINTFRQIYGIIYRHVVSKKPKTFDEWLKITRFSDIDHIYAALHRATFAGSNFIHYECPECHHIFVHDYDFEKDMVVYNDDKAKAKIQNIFRSNDTSIPDYDVELNQISDRYVVGLKDPSIWNMVMETAALSDDFLSKYEDLIDTMSFIDSIYLIDEDSGVLRPVDFGYDKNNPAKSTARKITILSDIIRTLSSDNYFALRGYIAKLFSSSNDIRYQIPGSKCPKCGHEINPEPSEAMRILFTRHQLGALESI